MGWACNHVSLSQASQNMLSATAYTSQMILQIKIKILLSWLSEKYWQNCCWCAECSPIDNLHIVQLADHVLTVCKQCHTCTTADSTPTIRNSWLDVGLEISDCSNSHIIKDITGMQKKNYVPHSLQKWQAYITANLNPEQKNKTDAFLHQSQRLTDTVNDNQYHFDCWIPGNVSSDMKSLDGAACSTNTSVWAQKPVPRFLQVLHYDAEMYHLCHSSIQGCIYQMWSSAPSEL